MLENGKAVFDFYNPRYRQALAEIKKWVDAGVVDPEIFTHKGPDFWNKVYQGRIGIVQGRWPELRKPEFEKVIKEVNPKAEWILVQPPKGPFGAFYGGFAKGSASQIVLSATLGEPKNAAKLKKVIELIEYAASDEGLRLVQFGIEGTHYKTEGGKIVALDKMNELTWTWAIMMVGRKDLEYLPVKFAYAAKEVEACIKYPFLQAFDKVVGNFPESIPKADIDRFISDNLIAFLYGTKPLSEYDAFVKELETKYSYKAYMDFIVKEMKVQL
jgi:putative aldouronate transport system substrate-binding protein